MAERSVLYRLRVNDGLGTVADGDAAATGCGVGVSLRSGGGGG